MSAVKPAFTPELEAAARAMYETFNDPLFGHGVDWVAQTEGVKNDWCHAFRVGLLALLPTSPEIDDAMRQADWDAAVERVFTAAIRHIAGERS